MALHKKKTGSTTVVLVLIIASISHIICEAHVKGRFNNVDISKKLTGSNSGYKPFTVIGKQVTNVAFGSCYENHFLQGNKLCVKYRGGAQADPMDRYFQPNNENMYGDFEQQYFNAAEEVGSPFGVSNM